MNNSKTNRPRLAIRSTAKRMFFIALEYGVGGGYDLELTEYLTKMEGVPLIVL